MNIAYFVSIILFLESSNTVYWKSMTDSKYSATIWVIINYMFSVKLG